MLSGPLKELEVHHVSHVDERSPVKTVNTEVLVGDTP